MVRFEEISTIEKLYPYEPATASAEYINGAFGSVNASTGVFTIGANKMKCIMNVEMGDDAYSDAYKVKEGQDLRIADLEKADGKIVNITSNQLPASGVVVGAKLVSASSGNLVVTSSSSATYLEIVEVMDYGVRAKINVVSA